MIDECLFNKKMQVKKEKREKESKRAIERENERKKEKYC
jgi:hypothetical protein